MIPLSAECYTFVLVIIKAIAKTIPQSGIIKMLILYVRDRPFNLKGGGGGYGFLFRFEFFFQNLTLGYMTKTLNQIIFFFLHQNQNIFFSNIGNQNIFLEKNHNPPFKLNGRSLICLEMLYISF